jgi:hypothetical protein
MKITKQRLKEIIKEELGESRYAMRYVNDRPEDAAKMLEELQLGIARLNTQISDLHAVFRDMDPGARDRAAHGLQEVKTLLESIKL